MHVPFVSEPAVGDSREGMSRKKVSVSFGGHLRGSVQKPRKSKQKSLLSWVGLLDNKANVEDENVEKSCDAEMPERSSESGQDYAAVESIKAVGSQLPLLGEEISQEIISFYVLCQKE